MNSTIYTLGYVGRKIESVDALLARFDALLVDVRMVPRSRIAVWNNGVLHRHFGERYLWLKEFGNRNYKGTFEQIEIVNFPAGEQRLRELTTTTGRPVMLMCGCLDMNHCHRKLLAEWLAQRWNAPVEHLQPHTENHDATKRQPTLF